MKILGFDSTAKAASVAVTEDDRLISLYTVDNGLTQSELLLPMAESILKSLHLSFSDIDAFACAEGPGSFTGVRIGVSLVKGLAFGRDVACIGVSTLEALARNLYPLEGIILPCMDARRGQVYTATFICEGGEMKRLTEDRAMAITSLAEEMRDYEGKNVYIVGDGYDNVTRVFEELGVVYASTPTLLINENAYSVAVCAYQKYKSGEYKKDTELAPTYLRMPQAERERLEKLKESNN